MNEETELNITPEDLIRLILKNLNKWKKEDKVEDNLKKILWYFEDRKFNRYTIELDI